MCQKRHVEEGEEEERKGTEKLPGVKKKGERGRKDEKSWHEDPR